MRDLPRNERVVCVKAQHSLSQAQVGEINQSINQQHKQKKRLDWILLG